MLPRLHKVQKNRCMGYTKSEWRMTSVAPWKAPNCQLVCDRNDTDMNQPQPSNPPETPTPPPGGTLNNTRAPEPMTLPEKHQAALRHIHTLESHNAKLYEDNCRLVNAVNTLNDRLTFFGAPQSTQVLRLADMQEKLRSSEANQALINRKYRELLQRTSAGSAQHHISEELQAIREAYASLDREYRLFRLKTAADASRVVLQQPQGMGACSLLFSDHPRVPTQPPSHM